MIVRHCQCYRTNFTQTNWGAIILKNLSHFVMLLWKDVLTPKHFFVLAGLKTVKDFRSIQYTRWLDFDLSWPCTTSIFWETIIWHLQVNPRCMYDMSAMLIVGLNIITSEIQTKTIDLRWQLTFTTYEAKMYALLLQIFMFTKLSDCDCRWPKMTFNLNRQKKK